MIRGFLVEADAIVACQVCGADIGVPCKAMKKKGIVHFARRVKRLLSMARTAPEEREKLEGEAVKMVVEHLAKRKKSL